MDTTGLTELEIFEKKRKRKLIVTPFILLFVVVIIVFAANILTKISDELNVVLPVRMTVVRINDGRTTNVVEEKQVKDITRAFNRLKLTEIPFPNDIYNYIENAYEVVMLFEDEDGYEHEERYFFAGRYINIQTEDSSTFYRMERKQSDSLRETVRAATRRNKDNN